MSFPHNNEGRKVITDTYDVETCKEIVNNGCISGVCSQHIHYVDTISFFDKYEGEVLSEIKDILGVDTLVDIFKYHDADYDAYRNDCVWSFIELVAMDVVTEMEKIEYEQNELIESYMQPVGTNTPHDMNPNRYLHA